MAEKAKDVRHKMDIYEKVMSNVEEEIMLLDRGFRILWANKNILKKYGTKDLGVIGGYCYKVTHDIDHVCQPPGDVCPIKEIEKTGKPATVTHTHFDRDGNKIYAEVSAYPIYEDGEVREYIHISRDVTERVMTEERLRDQQEAIRELSTPVITIWEGIITIPLIGIVDSPRAKQIMENLLNAIVETQASTAVIDITGVPMVDTEVADRLMRTVKAASLLGTECIVVGIRPEIAETLVGIGVDLSGIETYATLQAGLKAAFKKMGLKVERI